MKNWSILSEIGKKKEKKVLNLYQIQITLNATLNSKLNYVDCMQINCSTFVSICLMANEHVPRIQSTYESVSIHRF